MISSACVGLYKTPREIMQMTVAEIEVLSCYQPDKKKKNTLGLIDPEQLAFQKRLEYMALTPREKIEKRRKDRDG